MLRLLKYLKPYVLLIVLTIAQKFSMGVSILREEKFVENNIEVRLANYLDQAQQKWTITAATNAGGYPGSPYFKITIAGTDRALAATADGEIVAVPSFTSSPEQLWRIDQLTDGTFRIMPKAIPHSGEPLALTAVGSSTPTLAKFDPVSYKARWSLKAP